MSTAIPTSRGTQSTLASYWFLPTPYFPAARRHLDLNHLLLTIVTRQVPDEAIGGAEIGRCHAGHGITANGPTQLGPRPFNKLCASLLGISAITVRWHLSMGRRDLTRILRPNMGDTHENN